MHIFVWFYKCFKMRKSLLLLLVLTSAVSALAQDKGLRYEDALNFRMINNGFDHAVKTTPYTRLPDVLKDSLVTDCWRRSLNSTGLGFRFATDSKAVAVRYELMSGNHMNHMADTGIKGCDLYTLTKDGWRYVNTLRPGEGLHQEKVFVKNLDGQMHEYMIYLPLYDGVTKMEIGVDQKASLIRPQVDSPKASRGKVVFYGTSIMQGGCASRTGMCGTNIIQRELDIECVNFGISGQGKMYQPMANMMAAMDDVVCYVIDPVPNCTEKQCDTLTYGFVKTLRNAHPDVPIIMVEGPLYPYTPYDSYFRSYLPAKNAAYYKNYLKLKKENPKNLYYVTSDGLQAEFDEGTVDACHLTDLGFRAYADKLEKVLRKVLGKKLK